MTEERGQFQAWMDERLRLLEQDRDEVIIISGDERMGKSSLAYIMALYMDKRFNVQRQICFSGPQYTRASARLGRGRVLILDEAIQGGFSGDTGTSENRDLFKYLTVAGERNQIHLVLWPNIRWLDKRLKEHRARWNLHVTKRYADHAMAWVRLLREGEFTYDPPKRCFPFTYPRAEGPGWEKYRQLKAQYVQETGRGKEDGSQVAMEDFGDKVRGALGDMPELAGLGD